MKLNKVRAMKRVQEIPPVVKRQELNAIAPVMAENYLNVNPSQKARLTKPELTDLIIMLAEDATNQAIINKFKNKYNRTISTATIYKYRKKYEHNIFEMAKNFETLSEQVGLRKKANRLRKMQRLAEALEESIYDAEDNLTHGASPKVITEYRETLKQIAMETGGIDSGQIGDVIFANVSDVELKELVANKLGGNKALSVILAEQAGVRPALEAPIDSEYKIIEEDINGELDESDNSEQ